MRYLSKFTALTFVVNFVLCAAIGISSKLDFDSPRTSSKLIDTVNKYKPTVVYKNINIDGGKNEDTHVGVICKSGGCNTTTTDKSDSKDSIETDVVVHVKTNVSVKNNTKTNFEDDTPDIPVIVGSPDPNRNHNPFIVRPTFETIVDEGVVSITPSPVPPPSYNYLRPSLVPSSLQSSKTYYQNFHYPTTEHLPKINIESLLSEKEGRSAVDNSANAVEIHVPHFESSYHNHYFGENPPPQVVWFPKTAVPAFKNRGSVKSTLWSLEDLVPTTPRYHGPTCTCKQHVDRGLQWYPTKRSHGVNPGSQINDKLARLD